MELPEKYAHLAGSVLKTGPSRPRKYNNQPVVLDGVRYDSKREAEFAQELTFLQNSKLLKDWNTQVNIFIEVTTAGKLLATSKNIYLPSLQFGTHIAGRICVYRCDFLLVHPDDSVELVEIKSQPTMTAAYKLKYKMLELSLLRDHPEIRYRVVT